MAWKLPHQLGSVAYFTPVTTGHGPNLPIIPLLITGLWPIFSLEPQVKMNKVCTLFQNPCRYLQPQPSAPGAPRYLRRNVRTLGGKGNERTKTKIEAGYEPNLNRDYRSAIFIYYIYIHMYIHLCHLCQNPLRISRTLPEAWWTVSSCASI